MVPEPPLTASRRAHAAGHSARNGRKVSGDALKTVNSTDGTYERILSAAIKVLNDDGAVGISTRRVAQQAGANQALVHYYFRSIENLMATVVERIGEVVVEHHEGRYAARDRAFVELWREDVDEIRFSDPALIKVWFEAVAIVLNASDDVKRSLVTQRHRARALVHDAVTSELSQRSDAPGLDVEADAITTLLSLIRTGLQVDVLLNNVEGHEAALELLTTVLGPRLAESS
jgi:AcrR family transcriptional regulator